MHYVDKNKPQSAIPKKPEKDKFYEAWEEAVREWAKKNNYISELPPTGYDDLHVPANKPQISITSPQSNASVGRSFTATIKTSAPRVIRRVEYFVDNNLVYTASSYPFYGIIIEIQHQEILDA